MVSHLGAQEARVRTAQEFVALASAGFAGARDIFASPCDFFGEQLHRDELDQHLAYFEESDMLLTSQPTLYKDDEYTVVFEISRAWQEREGDWVQQDGVCQFMTFTHGRPLCIRMGYTSPPPKPVPATRIIGEVIPPVPQENDSFWSPLVAAAMACFEGLKLLSISGR